MSFFAHQLDYILPLLHFSIFVFIFFRVFLSKPSIVSQRTSNTPKTANQLRIAVPKLQPRTVASLLNDVLPKIFRQNINYFEYFCSELRQHHVWVNFVSQHHFRIKHDIANLALWLSIALLINIHILYFQDHPLSFLPLCRTTSCDDYVYANAVSALLIITILVNSVKKIYDYIFLFVEFYYDYVNEVLPDRSLYSASRMIATKPKSSAMKTSTIYVLHQPDDKSLEEAKFYDNIEDQHMSSLDIVQMEDELEILQTRKITLFRAIRYYILQKTIDFVPTRKEVELFLLKQHIPAKYEQLAGLGKSGTNANKTVIEKYTTGITTVRGLRWQQAPVEFDGSYHWINYLKQFYKYFEYSLYRVGGSPKSVYSFLTFARIIYPALINRQLLSVRLHTKYLHNRLLHDIPPLFLSHQMQHNSRTKPQGYTTNNNMIPFPRHINKYLEREHDIWLLERFFVEWFDGYSRELLTYIFRQHDLERRNNEQWDFFFTFTFRFMQDHANENNYQNIIIYRNRYYYLVNMVYLYLGILLAGTIYTSCFIETKNVIFVLSLLFCNYIIYVGILSAYFILLWKLILPLMVKDQFSQLYLVLSKRFPWILSRNTRYLSNIHGMLQHFHPICRLARIFPQYPVSRWLITIQDDDLPNATFPSKKTPYNMESLETGSVLFRDNLLVVCNNIEVFFSYYFSRIRHYGAQLGKGFFYILLIIGGDTLREIFVEGIVIYVFYSVGTVLLTLSEKTELFKNSLILMLLIFSIVFSIFYGLGLLPSHKTNVVLKRNGRKRLLKMSRRT